MDEQPWVVADVLPDLDGLSEPRLREMLTFVDENIAALEKQAERGDYPEDAKNLRRSLRVRRVKLIHQLNQLANQRQMTELVGAVEAKVDDPEARQQLLNLVAEIRNERQELARENQARDDADAKALRNFEHRWRIRKSFLDREPMAVLIGGVLLSVIALAFVVGMFIHTPPPDILANAFLLILGFFFGQTTSGRPVSLDADESR